jgi:hypothetical protein
MAASNREPVKQSRPGAAAARSTIRQSVHRPVLKTSANGAAREAVRQSPARKLNGN